MGILDSLRLAIDSNNYIMSRILITSVSDIPVCGEGLMCKIRAHVTRHKYKLNNEINYSYLRYYALSFILCFASCYRLFC